MRMTTESTTDETASILLVDDDAISLHVLRSTLDGKGFRLLVTRKGEDALKVARRERPLVILLDVMMPEMDGYETCRRLKADPETAGAAVIFLSALDETSDKVHGLEVGAVDFITKPFQADEVVARVHTHLMIQRLQRQLEQRNKDLARELAVAQELLSESRRRVEGPLLGNSPAVRALRECIRKHAASAEPLLLTGVHGSGQEAIARAIHDASPRHTRAFIHVNCALLPPGQDRLLASAAPDDGPRMSLLELADGGTIYLDEVQKLPEEVQDRLAGVVAGGAEDGKNSRSSVPDVRLIASCSASLSETSGFQPKLLFQLEPCQLRIPSLTERSEDIPELAQFFVKQYARRIGSIVEGITDESLKRLGRYRWPGGVYELRNLMERAVTSARGALIEVPQGLLDEGVPLGSYRLIKKLGAGGMGEVWRARHSLLARPCAIKLIRSELLGQSNHDQALERFRREARTIARLSSPNTVRLFDFGVSETGTLFFAMELLEGMDLLTLVEKYGPLPPERAVAILQQACRSLAEAHMAGVLHRDIKPQNLFLCRLGVDVDIVKVLDFGLAKSFFEQEDQITAAGALTGTPAYMPPERALGRQADEKSDLYSLGCVGYFMLTGKPVFTGEPMAVMIDHIRSIPNPPSKASKQRIPIELDDIVIACLQKAPEKRPPSALELWRRLEDVPVESPWTPARAEEWWREHVLADAPSSALEISMNGTTLR
jgi:DNA-binding NtrC family response regulator